MHNDGDFAAQRNVHRYLRKSAELLGIDKKSLCCISCPGACKKHRGKHSIFVFLAANSKGPYTQIFKASAIIIKH